MSSLHGAASIAERKNAPCRPISTMSYAFQHGDLPKLDLQVHRGMDFKAWKTQWDAYISLSGLDTQAATKQVQALTLCFSHETVTMHR